MSEQEKATNAAYATLQEEANKALSTHVETPMGFEDEDESDFIIPRIKVINALSPERKEKIADEGDIVNSLTKEKLNGKIFIPIYKFTSAIKWKSRDEGGGIDAFSRDGKIAVPTDGSPAYPCAHLCEFDNSKTGKDSHPVFTKYMNFFGFFAGEQSPIVLSFAKTNYAEGKRLFSLAKVSMQNMWHNGYRLDSKLIKKNANEWYNVAVIPNGAVSDEDKVFGAQMFQMFRNKDIDFDVKDGESEGSADNARPADVSGTEF